MSGVGMSGIRRFTVYDKYTFLFFKDEGEETTPTDVYITDR
jgi:hypothetical protein